MVQFSGDELAFKRYIIELKNENTELKKGVITVYMLYK